jgi:hypothetical protein
MKKSLPLFGIVCTGIAVVLSIRILELSPLYLYPQVRTNVQAALENIAESEGVLLSGFSITALSKDTMRVSHRAHARGKDTRTCFAVELSSSLYLPCSDS